ncbi:MAG: GAF domain-containing protein [Rubripirellula sp.]
MVSVITLSAKQLNDEHDNVVGVFEVWEPVGVYEELALKVGFFGKMERFRNVSSFVRFEKGNGLPGQVWQQRAGVIHDDLSNHPGFLRAAGASADLLVTAIGLPVATNAYHASVLLISSCVSPLARGFEVWQPVDDGFSLLGGAYRGLGDGIDLPAETHLPTGQGLPGLAARAGSAVLSEDVETLFAGRGEAARLPEAACGLAIPYFDGETLTSVATLLF